jgi:nicotinamidase-related amidase
MKTALILIDIQNDYFPGGKNEMVNQVEAGLRAGEVLSVFRSKKLPVVHIQHIADRPGATSFIAGTPGAEIHASVAPMPGELVFQKHYPSAFRETPLLEHLRKEQVTHLVFVGSQTQMCIDTSIRAAFDLGFECTLIHDACATKSLKFGERVVAAEDVQAAFLAAIGARFAKVISAAEWISSFN